ncbi:MAG TPA: histidine kinase dimerization/phospho-acceptor domain-containing protein, partial [Dehalococcoidia bacterium]|nr:histidine kinase dimerization/phospho-acceptor domain-containing protein [Dehalococcoidia bacterium]
MKAIKSVTSTEKRPLGLRQIYLWPSLALMALTTLLGIAISWQLVGSDREIGVEAILPHLLAWSVLFLAFSLLISWLSQRLSLQLEHLARAVERVAAGHYQERVQVQGSREMRQLASAFNHMAEALGDSRGREIKLLEEMSQMETLKELDRLKTDFLATISHELRTPLTLITGYAELLSSREKLSPRGQEMAQTALRESQRMASLVDDLLDLSRMETEGLELHK